MVMVSVTPDVPLKKNVAGLEADKLMQQHSVKRICQGSDVRHGSGVASGTRMAAPELAEVVATLPGLAQLH